MRPFIKKKTVLFCVLRTRPGVGSTMVGSVGDSLVAYCHMIESGPARLVTSLSRVRGRCCTLNDRRRRGTVFVRMHSECGAGTLSSVRGAALFFFLGHAYFGNLCHIGGDGGFGIPFNGCTAPAVYSTSAVCTSDRLLRGMRVLYNSFRRAVGRTGKSALFCFSPPCHPLDSASDFGSCAGRTFGSSTRHHLGRFYSEMGRRKRRFVLDGSSYLNGSKRSHFFSSLFTRCAVGEI